MPCPNNETCYLCGKEMHMTAISYGGEGTRIDWKCKCGALTTTDLKECKMYGGQVDSDVKIKLCKDCKHFIEFYDYCGLSEKKRSLVNGKMRYNLASYERDWANWIWWKCGKNGRFWESIEE